jgi:hypothetical protein
LGKGPIGGENIMSCGKCGKDKKDDKGKKKK